MHSIHELSRRELRLTELMVMAVNECRSHWRTLGKLVLYLGFPIEIVLQLGLSYLQNLMLQVDMDTVMQSTQNMIRFAQSSQWQAILAVFFGIMILNVILTPLLIMAVAASTASCLKGVPIRAFSAIKQSFARGFVVVPAVIVYILCVGIGLVFFVVPGLYLAIVFFFFEYAVILEEKGVFGSLKRSMFLVKGFFWKTALAAVCLFLMRYAASYVLNVVASLLGGSYLAGVLVGVCAMAVESYFAVVMTLYYLNRLAIKEEGLATR
ncbi:MAG TPA: hypothetical protein H9687_00365 [Firmicutes bacterium]|nr:hypothetical protein [Bacillota bacterium]